MKKVLFYLHTEWAGEQANVFDAKKITCLSGRQVALNEKRRIGLTVVRWDT